MKFDQFLWLRLVLLCGLLSSCFFAPNMNLPLKNQPLIRSSEINKVKINLYPIDQNIINYPKIYGSKPLEYILESKDVISITIWGHPEFSSSFATDNNSFISATQKSPTLLISGAYSLTKKSDNSSDSFVINSLGNVHILFAGSVHLAGLTVDEARSKIESSLARYIINASAKVTIVGFRSQFAYVIGEVLQQQILPITDTPLNLMSALELSGGINIVTANVNQIYILRLNPTDSTINAYWLDAGSVAAMLYAQSFYLQNNDIVYVSTSGLAQFNRVMSQLLPTAETLWYTKNSLPASSLPGILN